MHFTSFGVQSDSTELKFMPVKSAGNRYASHTTQHASFTSSGRRLPRHIISFFNVYFRNTNTNLNLLKLKSYSIFHWYVYFTSGGGSYYVSYPLLTRLSSRELISGQTGTTFFDSVAINFSSVTIPSELISWQTDTQFFL